MLNISF